MHVKNIIYDEEENYLDTEYTDNRLRSISKNSISLFAFTY